MSPRKSAKEQAQGRLLDYWEPREEFGEPEGCVSTTFTFDAPFYEEDCLGRFVGMQSHASEDGRVYLVEREERLAQVFALVLVDRSHVPTHRSLRWQVLPIAVPRGGILHAKMSLLVWRNHIRVLIGSANLTRPGYRRSYEQMAVLDYTSDGDIPLAPLRECLDFLEGLLPYSPAQEQAANEGPKARFTGFLDSVRRKIARWEDPSWGRGEPTATLVTIGPNRPTLFEQLEPIWGATGPSDAFVLSPFYEERDRARDVLDGLMRLLAVRGERSVQFSASGRKLPDGSIELDLPSAYRTSAHARCGHAFARVLNEGVDGQGEHRPLHAKALWLRRDVDAGVRVMFVLGSSNFTCPGCGVGRGAINIEANLAYLIPPNANTFWAICKEAWPPEEDLDLAAQTVNFLNPEERETDGSSLEPPLPIAFGMAIFIPAAEGGSLSLSIGENAPPEFTVMAEEHTLLTHDEWVVRGSQPLETLEWKALRPPSYLVVTWRGSEGELLRGIWPVNVSDAGLLPPPDELRNLSLDQLHELLTSSSPIHETMRRLLARGERSRAGEAQPERQVDLLRRADSSRFLLRRMRAVSHALEGLRARLQRPVSTADALTWRLEGPVGAVALARSLARDDPQGAAFMIAEVAFTVAKTDWSIAEQTLGKPKVKAIVEKTLATLRELAGAQEAPTGLRQYVDDAFQEISK